MKIKEAKIFKNNFLQKIFCILGFHFKYYYHCGVLTCPYCGKILQKHKINLVKDGE